MYNIYFFSLNTMTARCWQETRYVIPYTLYLLQTVSLLESLHEMSTPVFWGEK